MGKGKRLRSQNNQKKVKKTMKDEEQPLSRPNFFSDDASERSRDDKLERKKDKNIKKPTNKRPKQEQSSQSESVSSPPESSKSQMSAESSSRRQPSPPSRYSNSSSEKQADEYKRKEKGISQYLDVMASESSGNEESESDQENLREHRLDFQKVERQMKEHKGQASRYYSNIIKMKDDEVNQHYQKKWEEMIKEEEREAEESAMYADLYQIGCSHGMEQELVGWILNKKKYSLKYPKLFYCTLLSAMAVPKRFPGLIFLEAKSLIEVEKSIRGLKFIRLKTLKKIQYEILTNLFDPQRQIQFEYKVKQYVRIKAGRYKEDIGQITKINRKGVVVQLVPRIDFVDIENRMNKLQYEYRKINFKEDEIVRAKNNRFRELVDPRGNEKNRAKKKKLSPADFEPFSGYSYIKRIKITADGLLLVNYYFNEIQLPKTSFSPQEILELNRGGQQKQEVIKREQKNIRMGTNLNLSDPVQIIAGELIGCFGKIQQVQTRIVKIKCQNKEMKGLVIEEISDNVVRMFKEGDSVIVTHGASRGQVGTVFKNGISHVKLLSANNERIKVNKRDIQLKNLTSIVFDNDIGIKQGDIVKTRLELGIVCDAKKGYVDFVTPKNEIKRATNNDLTKVTNYRLRAYSRGNQSLQRDCLVKILEGKKKDKVFKIKQIYSTFVFLHDSEDNHLFGNWVEKAENCSLYLTVPPRIEARFLEDQGMDRKFFKDRRPQEGQQRHSSFLEEDPIKVGKYYRLTQGAFRGVKGVITATFKTHFEVLVFNSKIERVNRSALSATKRHRRSPKNSGDQQAGGEYLSRAIQI